MEKMEHGAVQAHGTSHDDHIVEIGSEKQIKLAHHIINTIIIIVHDLRTTNQFALIVFLGIKWTRWNKSIAISIYWAIYVDLFLIQFNSPN